MLGALAVINDGDDFLARRDGAAYVGYSPWTNIVCFLTDQFKSKLLLISCLKYPKVE
jgi:hypothetical protein